MLKHEKYKELLQLHVYDEISNKEKLILENHLLECEECSEELKTLKKLYVAFAENAPVLENEELLDESREELFNKLTIEKKFSIKEFIMDLFDFRRGSFGFAMGGIALFVIGLFAGKLFFNQQLPVTNLTENSADKQSQIRVSNISLPIRADGSNEFEIFYETVEHNKFTGNLMDPEAKKLLAAAIKSSSNDWTKLKTISALMEIKSLSVNKNDILIKTALIETAKNDINPAVRKEAIMALGNIEIDSQITSALISVLKSEKNAGNRILAVNILSKNKSLSTSNNIYKQAIEQAASRDENSFVRLQAKSLLK